MIPREHFCYVVVWPESGYIKAGYTADPARWRSFAGHRDGVIFSLTEFQTEKLARAYEATVLAMLDLVARRAFRSHGECRQRFGRDNGYTEIFYLPVRQRELTVLAGWLPVPYLGEPRRTPEQAMDVLAERQREVVAAVRQTFSAAIREAKYKRLAAVAS